MKDTFQGILFPSLGEAFSQEDSSSLFCWRVEEMLGLLPFLTTRTPPLFESWEGALVCVGNWWQVMKTRRTTTSLLVLCQGIVLYMSVLIQY